MGPRTIAALPGAAEPHAQVDVVDPVRVPADQQVRHTVPVPVADIAEQVGYLARRREPDGLEVAGHDSHEHYLLTYDDAQRKLVDVTRLRERVARPWPPLLDAASRQRLPPLGSGEKLGMKALAQVKFFTPDAYWIWYASEFDGEELFFGLVIGDFIEFGSFALSELAEVRGALGLPVERDKFFTPTTLGELKAKHEQERRQE